MNIQNRFFWGILAISLLAGLSACSRHPNTGSMAEVGKTQYHCAMHPRIISDKPGECPICHMKLVPFQLSSGNRPMEAEKRILYYRNPMNPAVTSPVPTKDSMGMDYLPVYADQATETSSVTDHAAVQMTSDIQQRIGVTVSSAEVRELNMPIHAAARVAYDPDLYSALAEHQEAMRYLEKVKNQGDSDLLEQAQDTVRSSRQRLHQMGLSDDQIESMGQPGYNLSDMLPGSHGDRVWVYIDVSADRMGLVKPGEKVELTSPSIPGETFSGTVQSIDSIMNTDSRTVRVRALVIHAPGLLKQEMVLSATIYASLGKRLAVPVSAVVDTGTRQLVYMEKQPGSFEPRDVQVGQQAEEYVEIRVGLQAGERVATSANFLIDSESRIQGAAQAAK